MKNRCLLGAVSTVVMFGILISGCSANSSRKRDDDDDDDEVEEAIQNSSYNDPLPWLDDKGASIDYDPQPESYAAEGGGNVMIQSDDDYDPDYGNTPETSSDTPRLVDGATPQEFSDFMTEAYKGWLYSNFVNDITAQETDFEFNITGLYGPDSSPVQVSQANYYAIQKIVCDPSAPTNLSVYLTYNLFGLSLNDALNELQYTYGIPLSRIGYSGNPTIDEAGNIIPGSMVIQPDNWYVGDIIPLSNGGVYLSLQRNELATFGNGINIVAGGIRAFIEGVRGN